MFPSIVRIKTEIDSLEYIYKKCRNKNTYPPTFEEIGKACGYTKQAFYRIPSVKYTLDILKKNKLVFQNNFYSFDENYIILPLGIPNEIYNDFENFCVSKNILILFDLKNRPTVKRKMQENIIICLNKQIYNISMLLDRTSGSLKTTYSIKNQTYNIETTDFAPIYFFVKYCVEFGCGYLENSEKAEMFYK